VQSVFVKEQERRKGCFKQLFGQVVSMARENGVETLKLYVEVANVRAR
jgi:hypothetical protein